MRCTQGQRGLETHASSPWGNVDYIREAPVTRRTLRIGVDVPIQQAMLLRGPARQFARRFTPAARGASSQRVVVAVGGNALQRRGDRLTIENMLKAGSAPSQ